jgi:hypothetical protein
MLKKTSILLLLTSSYLFSYDYKDYVRTHKQVSNSNFIVTLDGSNNSEAGLSLFYKNRYDSLGYYSNILLNEDLVRANIGILIKSSNIFSIYTGLGALKSDEKELILSNRVELIKREISFNANAGILLDIVDINKNSAIVGNLSYHYNDKYDSVAIGLGYKF